MYTLYCDINKIPIRDGYFILNNELNCIHEWLACKKLLFKNLNMLKLPDLYINTENVLQPFQ